jgi:uncharacterized membrane protein
LSKQKAIISGILIGLLALIIRLWDLGARSIWLDEAVEYWTASVPLRSIPETVTLTFQPPLYSFLLHIWLFFGASDRWLRLLSVVLSLLALLGLFLLARKLIGLRGALIASALFAVMPTSVRYAQDVGEYALLETTLIWALLFLVLALAEGHLLSWLLFGIAASASVYSHYGAIIPLLGIGIILLVHALRKRDTKTIAGLASATAVSFLLCLPLFLYFLPSQRVRIGNVSLALPFRGIPNEASILLDAARDALGFPIIGWPFTQLKEIYTWIGLAIFVALACFVLMSRMHSRLNLPIIWLLAAFSSYYIFVRTGLYSYGSFGFRYVLILTPLIILVIAVIIEHFFLRDKHYLAYLLFVITISLELYSLPNKSISDLTRDDPVWPEAEDISPIMAYWSNHSHPSDITYVYYGASPAFRYYFTRFDIDSKIAPNWYFECMAGFNDVNCRDNGIYYGEWYRDESVENIRVSIERTLPHNPENLWLIFSHKFFDDEARTLMALDEAYQVLDQFSAQNASIFRLVRRLEIGE